MFTLILQPGPNIHSALPLSATWISGHFSPGEAAADATTSRSRTSSAQRYICCWPTLSRRLAPSFPSLRGRVLSYPANLQFAICCAMMPLSCPLWTSMSAAYYTIPLSTRLVSMQRCPVTRSNGLLRRTAAPTLIRGRSLRLWRYNFLRASLSIFTHPLRRPPVIPSAAHPHQCRQRSSRSSALPLPIPG